MVLVKVLRYWQLSAWFIDRPDLSIGYDTRVCRTKAYSVSDVRASSSLLERYRGRALVVLFSAGRHKT